MAKNLDVFKGKYRPAQASDDSDLGGNIRSTGVGLSIGEIAALDAIGEELGTFMDSEKVARNTLIRDAVRRFIKAYRAGEITTANIAQAFEIPEKPKPKYRG